MIQLTVPILTWLCTLRRPPARGAQATSCFFPGSKYSGKFGFLACSGDWEPLVIYALTYPRFPLYATNISDKNTKLLIKSLPSSVSLASGLWSISEYKKLNHNLFLEAWLENLTDLRGYLRRRRTLPTSREKKKKTAKNIMKMVTKGHTQHSWFHVIFVAASWDMHCCLRWREDC